MSDRAKWQSIQQESHDSWLMGKISTIFQSEALVLNLCIENCLRKGFGSPIDSWLRLSFLIFNRDARDLFTVFWLFSNLIGFSWLFLYKNRLNPIKFKNYNEQHQVA